MKREDLVPGLTVWLHVYGTVTKTIVSQAQGRNASGVYVAKGEGSRYVGMWDLKNLHPTRKDAVAAAEPWINEKLRKARARVERLEKMEANLKRTAYFWECDDEAHENDLVRVQVGTDDTIVARVRQGKTHWIWNVGKVRGKTERQYAAQYAADEILLKDNWTLMGLKKGFPN